MRERFGRDERGSTATNFALAAAAIGFASLFLGTAAEQWASTGGLPTIALLTPDQYVATKRTTPNFNAVDYTSTGSIGSRVLLDPCTGAQKLP